MTQSPALPKTIGKFGRYVICEEMAAGGMSRVFLAHREGSSTLCVLKQLHGDLEKHSTAGIRFQREAHIVSQLHHPNIARVLDAGIEDGKFCIAMELIEGVTLRQVLDRMSERNEIVPPAITLALGVQILEGLAYAHGLRDAERHLGIVHRDLSPKNVMIDYSGQVKIIDFGVARGHIDNFRTAPGMMVGTLHYMSPEQALTEKIDHRSDLYTLSIVLWELLSGEHAVRDGKAVEVLEQVIDEKPRPLRDVRPSLPPAICSVIERGLEKDPGLRWQTAIGYREALRQATHPIDTVFDDQIGAFVRALLPPHEHPAHRWRTLFDQGPMQDVPTLADDGLKASDIMGLLVDQKTPDPSTSSSSTLTDLKPVPSATKTDTLATKPDMPMPSGGSQQELALMHTLKVENDRLRKALRRQRSLVRLLLGTLFCIAAAAGWYLGSQ